MYFDSHNSIDSSWCLMQVFIANLMPQIDANSAIGNYITCVGVFMYNAI